MLKTFLQMLHCLKQSNIKKNVFQIQIELMYAVTFIKKTCGEIFLTQNLYQSMKTSADFGATSLLKWKFVFLLAFSVTTEDSFF